MSIKANRVHHAHPRAVSKKPPVPKRPRPKVAALVSNKSAPRSNQKARKLPSSQTVPKTRRTRKVHQTKMVAEVSTDTASIRLSLDLLAKAQAEMTARGVDLLAVAHELGSNAVQAFKTSLVESLVEDQLLPDLKRLHSHLGSAAGQYPEFQLIAEATLNWFVRHFDLSESLEAGQLIEIPAGQLDQFDLDGASPESGTALVRVQVLASGWKCRGQIIIRPRVMLVGPTTDSAEKATETSRPNNPF